MRTLSSTTARLQSVATQPNQLIARLQSWWVAYLEWRIQREAMLQLEALSDRELHDIGVGAVKSRASSKVDSNASALSAVITEQDLRCRARFLGIARPQTEATAMTYTIARYPVHLIDFVSAANGRRVTIRPMLPQDFKLQREFFRSLSVGARYGRFLTSFNELPDAVAERLGKIDYSRHLALLAEVFEGNSETMVGEARYVLDEHDPATCEFAIAVADDWQGCGIGRALLAKLEREAPASSIRRMRADTLYDNKAMRRLAARSGYVVRANRDDARLVKLEKQLSAWMPANVQPLAA